MITNPHDFITVNWTARGFCQIYMQVNFSELTFRIIPYVNLCFSRIINRNLLMFRTTRFFLNNKINSITKFLQMNREYFIVTESEWPCNRSEICLIIITIICCHLFWIPVFVCRRKLLIKLLTNTGWYNRMLTYLEKEKYMLIHWKLNIYGF